MSLSADDLTKAFSTAFKESTYKLDIRALDIETEDKFESTILYNKWIKQFDRMMGPYAERDPKEKKAMLMIAIGENAAARYDLEIEVTNQGDEYKNARMQLENVYCVPDATAEAKVRFFRIRPTPEDVTKPLQFLNKLKAATNLCQFREPEHEVMRVMLSCCPNQKWQEKRITSKWTHENLKDGENYARTLEQMSLLTKEIRTSYVQTNKVNAVKTENNVALPKCSNCGGGHRPYPSGTCPAFGQECFACKGRNHFQAFCRSGRGRGRQLNHYRGFRGIRRPYRGSYRGSYTNRGRGPWRGRNSGQRRNNRRRGNQNQQSSVRAVTTGTNNGSNSANSGDQNQIVPYRGERNSDSFDQRASECLRNLNLTL